MTAGHGVTEASKTRNSYTHIREKHTWCFYELTDRWMFCWSWSGVRDGVKLWRVFRKCRCLTQETVKPSSHRAVRAAWHTNTQHTQSAVKQYKWHEVSLCTCVLPLCTGSVDPLQRSVLLVQLDPSNTRQDGAEHVQCTRAGPPHEPVSHTSQEQFNTIEVGVACQRPGAVCKDCSSPQCLEGVRI